MSYCLSSVLVLLFAVWLLDLQVDSTRLTSLKHSILGRVSKFRDYGSKWLSTPATASNIVLISDDIDKESDSMVTSFLKYRRHMMLVDMLQNNRSTYLATAKFLINRIPRNEFPNLQGLPLATSFPSVTTSSYDKKDDEIVEDCTLPQVKYQNSSFDNFLLHLFRKLVHKEIGFMSEKEGIAGLLEEARYFKLSPKGQENDSVNQHIFVRNVLDGLLPPFLPPMFRIFMSGLIPSVERGDPKWLTDCVDKIVSSIPDNWSIKKDLTPGSQVGPWFYAPYLTSVFTPIFMSFLVGPSTPNRRKDGHLGGMVVEKCKFLQESNCKGLCLHQCKIPAQEYFRDKLGLDLTVTPNFETQECQWSWGEKPLHHKKDPDFPKGCLRGCETRFTVINGIKIA